MFRYIALATSLLFACPAWSANVAGVFSPAVKEGHRATQYVVGHSADSGTLTQRLMTVVAFNQDFQGRFFLLNRQFDGPRDDNNDLQFDLTWQLADPTPAWQHALRFDLRWRNNDRAHATGLHWVNHFALSDRWSARAILMTNAELGPRRRNGLAIQTRASLRHRVNASVDAELSMFSLYGTTSDWRSSNEQQHQLGPTVAFKPQKNWRIEVGYLAGLTTATPDHEVRFRVTLRH